MLYPELSYIIVDAFFNVHRALGPGLLEFPYRNALALEFKRQGLFVQLEAPYPVYYMGEKVGFYKADIIVNNMAIIEVKSVMNIEKEHQAQLLNYLHLSGSSLGFIVNMRPAALQWKRMVLERKHFEPLQKVSRDRRYSPPATPEGEG